MSEIINVSDVQVRRNVNTLEGSAFGPQFDKDVHQSTVYRKRLGSDQIYCGEFDSMIESTPLVVPVRAVPAPVPFIENVIHEERVVEAPVFVSMKTLKVEEEEPDNLLTMKLHKKNSASSQYWNTTVSKGGVSLLDGQTHKETRKEFFDFIGVEWIRPENLLRFHYTEFKQGGCCYCCNDGPMKDFRVPKFIDGYYFGKSDAEVGKYHDYIMNKFRMNLKKKNGSGIDINDATYENDTGKVWKKRALVLVNPKSGNAKAQMMLSNYEKYLDFYSFAVS